jgi:hypothetical protein
MNNWFEVKVKYTKQVEEDGSFKRVSEPYLIQGMTFGDVETRTTAEVGSSIRGEFVVDSIKRFTVHDIFGYDDSDVWYKSTISFKSEEDGGKGKKVSQTFLTAASSVKEATERLVENLQGMMIDYEVTGTVVTPLMDIIPFDTEEGEEITDFAGEAVYGN